MTKTPMKGDVIYLCGRDITLLNGKIGIALANPNSDNEVKIIWSGGRVTYEDVDLLRPSKRKDNSVNSWRM